MSSVLSALSFPARSVSFWWLPIIVCAGSGINAKPCARIFRALLDGRSWPFFRSALSPSAFPFFALSYDFIQRNKFEAIRGFLGFDIHLFIYRDVLVVCRVDRVPTPIFLYRASAVSSAFVSAFRLAVFSQGTGKPMANKIFNRSGLDRIDVIAFGRIDGAGIRWSMERFLEFEGNPKSVVECGRDSGRRVRSTSHLGACGGFSGSSGFYSEMRITVAQFFKRIKKQAENGLLENLVRGNFKQSDKYPVADYHIVYLGIIRRAPAFGVLFCIPSEVDTEGFAQPFKFQLVEAGRFFAHQLDEDDSIALGMRRLKLVSKIF